MEQPSNVQKVHDGLKSLTASELKAVIDKSLSLFPNRICRFLDLPPELRNRIYRYSVRLEDIERHVKQGQAPALLKVNRQVSAEFKGLYYSHEFMRVEYYDVKVRRWCTVKGTRLFQLILAKRGLCQNGNLVQFQTRIREYIVKFGDTSFAEDLGARYTAVFIWSNGPGTAEIDCSYYDASIDHELWKRRHEESRTFQKKIDECLALDQSHRHELLDKVADAKRKFMGSAPTGGAWRAKISKCFCSES